MIRGTPASLILTSTNRSSSWLKMENSAFETDVEKGAVELNAVKPHDADIPKEKQIPMPQPPPPQCQPDLCRQMHAKYVEDKGNAAVNPWDSLKTRFLVSIIVLLTLWLLVYVVSSRMGLV